jgi:hypothetical protein
MSLATQAEESEKTRGYVPPDTSGEGNLRQKTAWAHEADRARNLARQSGQPYADETPAPLSPEQEAKAIAYSWGVGAAGPFIVRYLALEARVKKLEELLRLLTR